MKALYIKACPLHIRWYNKFVGYHVPYIGTVRGPTEHISIEPEGYKNYVQPEDAIIVDNYEGPFYHDLS
jgi:hypothetical protein